MVRSVPLPQLSSAKPRTGLQSVGALAERLIRMYELQESVRQQIAARSAVPSNDSHAAIAPAEQDYQAARDEGRAFASSPLRAMQLTSHSDRPQQATFDWYG